MVNLVAARFLTRFNMKDDSFKEKMSTLSKFKKKLSHLEVEYIYKMSRNHKTIIS